MNRGWGGAGPIMHLMQIEPACLGPYPKTLKVGDVQTMTFGEDDNGPFDYVKYERKHWLDQNGNILPQFELDAKKFLLTDLLSECPDFKYEKSAMQKLAEELSKRHQRKIELLISPKYHCKLAGEGIEYGWGLFKNIIDGLNMWIRKEDKNSQAVSRNVLKR